MFFLMYTFLLIKIKVKVLIGYNINFLFNSNFRDILLYLEN